MFFIHLILIVFLCLDNVALSNNVASLPQLRADLTRVLASIRLAKQIASLHQAAKLGQTQVVEQLLADGIELSELNAKDKEGKLAYEIAFEAGHVDLAVLLLKKTEGSNGRYSDGFTPLNIGLAIGDAKLVRAEIKDGADIFSGQLYNQHALYVAEYMEQEEMLLRALVAEDRFGDFGKNNKIFIDWIGERKLIPVIKDILTDPQLTISATMGAQLAVLADDEVMFQRALDAGAHHTKVWRLVGFRPVMFEQVIARLEEGSLHHAAAHGKREAMAALLAEGADINAVDGYGWSALNYAVFSGQVETTRDLCKADADVCVLDQAEYMLDADTPTVEILRAYADDKHPTEEDWLHYYLRKGQTARAINHIKSDYDPNELIHLGLIGIDDVSQYKDREDIDDARLVLDAESALHAAALYGNLELVKYLIETMQMDVNYKRTEFPFSGETALHMAAVGNHVEVASYLLAQGADVHARDRGRETDVGLTAMHYAAAYGNLEMAMFLAENGANVNTIGDGWGYNYWARITPLQLAIEGEANLELVEFLIKKLGWLRKRAKINRADGRGLTPLYRAVRSKNAEMVELLLRNGADPVLLIDNDEYLIGNLRYSAKKHNDATTFRIIELLEAHMPQR